MHLEQILAYIEKSHPQTINLGLERIQTVGLRANLFSFACPVVMVAGTNGKGSTVTALAKLLIKAGLKIGTYTSPHLLRFNERIQINEVPVSDASLCFFFEKIERLREAISLTFFEFTTLMALALFQAETPALDLIILEVGLGGRLDAVNAVDPTLAIITSISYDHQAYLGNTLESIASEKAGILRPSLPLVLSDQARVHTLIDKAHQLQCRVYSPDKIEKWEGNLPVDSVALACSAYQVLNTQIALPPLEAPSALLKEATLLGRFSSFEREGVKIILDVAHNPASSQLLFEKLSSKRFHRMIAVWASLADKNLAEIVEPMKSIVKSWCIGPIVERERSVTTDVLHRTLVAQNVSSIFTFSSILKAFEGAFQLAKQGEEMAIVVFGSFHTVAPILGFLREERT